MPVASTSIAAYHELDLTSQQRSVLAALVKLGESCIADIAECLNWQRSTVSGRLKELKQLDCLDYLGKRKSKCTAVRSEHWSVKKDVANSSPLVVTGQGDFEKEYNPKIEAGHKSHLIPTRLAQSLLFKILPCMAAVVTPTAMILTAPS